MRKINMNSIDLRDFHTAHPHLCIYFLAVRLQTWHNPPKLFSPHHRCGRQKVSRPIHSNTLWATARNRTPWTRFNGTIPFMRVRAHNKRDKIVCFTFGLMVFLLLDATIYTINALVLWDLSNWLLNRFATCVGKRKRRHHISIFAYFE